VFLPFPTQLVAAFPRAAFVTTGALVVAFLLATGIPAVNY
jgi:hypothetical protein